MAEETIAAGTPPTIPATLAVEHLNKTYTTAVLSDVTVELRAGEVHAILGENGAGKSTLINILSGTVRPTSGVLRSHGREIRIGSPIDALKLGISVVHQEFTYCPSLSVTENLFLGMRLPRRFGVIDLRQADGRAREVLDQLSVSVDVRTPIGRLSPETRKLVEIARALVHDSEVLILDEPTAALPAEESERLFEVIRRLRNAGVAVGYVSHRLDEVLSLSDRLSVLRDGHLIATRARAETDVDDLVRLMVGRTLTSEYPRREPPAALALGAIDSNSDSDSDSDGMLVVRGLSSTGAFRDVSFTAARGEIVGIGGLDASGRSELLQALAGDRRCQQGDVSIDGNRVGPSRGIHRAIQAGIAYVPPDRQHEGLHLEMSVARNIALPLLRRIGRGPFTNGARETRLAAESVERLDIRPPRPRQSCAAFSGGNQQKVLLAKWLAIQPRVLLLDEPTRGVDVGAKSEIHALMRALADAGTVIVLASTDLPELLGMAQRVIVLRLGQVSGVFDTANVTAEDIGHAATAAPVDATAGADSAAAGAGQSDVSMAVR